jgi:hypothetical protein
MSRTWKIIATGFVAATLLLGPSVGAEASFLIGGVSYLENASTESMSASFLMADGGVSTGTYSGLVKVKISGVGEALGTQLNDAFFVYTNAAHGAISPYNDANYYQIAFDTTTLNPLTPSRDAKHHIRYDVDAGTEVAPTYVPGYRADHTYTVVLDTGTATLSNLHFGVSNGIFTDNSGQYNLELTQLTAVPEPFSLAMLGLGLTAVGLMRRRKK